MTLHLIVGPDRAAINAYVEQHDPESFDHIAVTTRKAATSQFDRRDTVIVLLPGYEKHPGFNEIAEGLAVRGCRDLVKLTPSPTTAGLFAGYYRELRASGIPQGLAETMVVPAAGNDRRPLVHPDALAAVDSTRDKTRGDRERAESMARHPAGKG